MIKMLTQEYKLEFMRNTPKDSKNHHRNFKNIGPIIFSPSNDR